MKIQEKQLVSRSLRKLRRNPDIAACREVPILGRSADIAYFQNGFVYSIEFKLKDWKRALLQARDHLLGADYSYICMPKRSLSDEMTSRFRESGIGLFFFAEQDDWPFEEILKPVRSSETSETARRWTLDYIQQKNRRRK